MRLIHLAAVRASRSEQEEEREEFWVSKVTTGDQFWAAAVRHATEVARMRDLSRVPRCSGRPRRRGRLPLRIGRKRAHRHTRLITANRLRTMLGASINDIRKIFAFGTDL